MVASDDDGRRDLARFHEVVDDEAKPLTLAVSQPADAGGKPLELDLVMRHLDPFHQMLIIGELLQDNLVGCPDVLRVPRECCPAEGTLALLEQGTDVLWDEAVELERVLVPVCQSLATYVVAIVEDDGASFLQADHRLAVDGDGVQRAPLVLDGVARAQRVRLREWHAVGDVSLIHISEPT